MKFAHVKDLAGTMALLDGDDPHALTFEDALESLHDYADNYLTAILASGDSDIGQRLAASALQLLLLSERRARGFDRIRADVGRADQRDDEYVREREDEVLLNLARGFVRSRRPRSDAVASHAQAQRQFSHGVLHRRLYDEVRRLLDMVEKLSNGENCFPDKPSRERQAAWLLFQVAAVLVQSDRFVNALGINDKLLGRTVTDAVAAAYPWHPAQPDDLACLRTYFLAASGRFINFYDYEFRRKPLAELRARAIYEVVSSRWREIEYPERVQRLRNLLEILQAADDGRLDTVLDELAEVTGSPDLELVLNRLLQSD